MKQPKSAPQITEFNTVSFFRLIKLTESNIDRCRTVWKEYLREK